MAGHNGGQAVAVAVWLCRLILGRKKKCSVPLISVASACCHGRGEITVTPVQAVTHK